jgi:hypothetical protein
MYLLLYYHCNYFFLIILQQIAWYILCNMQFSRQPLKTPHFPSNNGRNPSSMKTFLLVVAALALCFWYAGTDLARHNKAAVTAKVEETAPKVLKSAKKTGADLADKTATALRH